MLVENFPRARGNEAFLMDLNLCIGFSTSNSWISKIIRWFTNSKISHCFVAVDLFGARLIIGAEAWGVDWRTKARFEEKNQIKVVLKPKALPIDNSFGWFVHEYAGASYDWGAAGATGIKAKLGRWWKLISHWFAKWPKDDALHCEEVPYKILEHAGYNIVQTLKVSTEAPSSDYISAEQMMQACLKSPEFDVIWKDKTIQ